jgi:MbtH protein
MSVNCDSEPFNVVINDEEQYSVWPAGRAIPPGWHVVGEPDTREACLDRVQTMWTDMRPRTLKEFLRAHEG